MKKRINLHKLGYLLSAGVVAITASTLITLSSAPVANASVKCKTYRLKSGDKIHHCSADCTWFQRHVQRKWICRA